MTLDYYDEDALAKQYIAIQRSGAVPMTDRDAVKFIAHEAGYEELYTWIEKISPDVYLIEAEKWTHEWSSRSIDPYSARQALDVLDPVQQEAIKDGANPEYDRFTRQSE